MTDGLTHVVVLIEMVQVKEVILLTHQVLHQTLAGQTIWTRVVGVGTEGGREGEGG